MSELSKVQSICPICNKPIEAVYVSKNQKVYLQKTCRDHGNFQSLVSNSEDDYLTWIKHPVINIPPKEAMTAGTDTDQCPLHCGTCGNHLQTACCIVIDITNRCNQKCSYCFARAEEDGQEGEADLKELERKLELLLALGEERPFNLQLSGGEPTVRNDLPELITMAKSKGFEYIQINSNGKRLGLEPDYALTLKRAGASVIFMQYDGTKDEIYKTLRGESLLELKQQAVKHCRRAGLAVTLVPTIIKDVNLDNIGEMMDYLMDNIDVIKGIHFQPVSFFGRHPEEQSGRSDAQVLHEDYQNRVTMFDVLRELEKQRPQFQYTDFAPIATGHTLCCFYSTYLKERGGKVQCTISKKDQEAGINCCDTQQTCCGSQDRDEALEIIKKDRDYVLNKWDLPEKTEGQCNCCCEPEPEAVMDLDQFLNYYKTNTFTVTGMAFQDKTNLDAERLKRCRVQVLSEDDRLIPFCGYNSIYRGEQK